MKNSEFDLSVAPAPDARSMEALKSKADQHLRNGDLKAALDSYLKVLPQAANDLQVLHGLAATLLKGGEKRIASDVYQKILRLSPADSIARLNLSLLTGDATLAAGREENTARAQTREATEAAGRKPGFADPPESGVSRDNANTPGSARSLARPALTFMAGLGMYREGNRQAALEECWRAIGEFLRSENSASSIELGGALLKILSALLTECGRFEEVVRLCEMGLARFGDVPWFVEYLAALALWKLQRPAEAATRLKRVIAAFDRMDPTASASASREVRASADFLRANLETCLYDFSSAEMALQRLLQQEPPFTKARPALAKIAAAKGETERAAQILRDALETCPWDISTWKAGHLIAQRLVGVTVEDEDAVPIPEQEIAPLDWEGVCLGAAAELFADERIGDAARLIETNFDTSHPAYQAAQMILSGRNQKTGWGAEGRDRMGPDWTPSTARAVTSALLKLRRSETAATVDPIIQELSVAMEASGVAVPRKSDHADPIPGKTSPERQGTRILYQDLEPEIHEFFRKTGLPERVCPIKTRSVAAQGIASLVNRYFEHKPNAFNQCTKRTLKQDGISRLGQVCTDSEVREIVAYFRSRPVFNSHVWAQSDGVPRYFDQDAKQHRFGSYKQADILNAPHLLEAALHPKILNIAEEYLGCAPLLFSINAWWNFGGFHKTIGLTQDFHRDLDDNKFLSFFIFLTDIGENGGQHTYIRKTHTPETLLNHVRDAGLVESIFTDGDYGSEKFPENVEKLIDLIEDFRGEAGQGFIADTYGLHRGVPSEQDRLVCWCRYGLRKNYAYEYDQTCRLPVSQLNRSLRLSSKTGFIVSLILDEET